MLRVLWLFLFAGLVWAATTSCAAESSLGFIPRSDWFGDPYLVTNPPGNALSPFSVSLVMNPTLVTNPDYQAKVTALASANVSNPDAGLIERILQNVKAAVARSETNATATGMISASANHEASVSHPAAADGISWPMLIERWLLFLLVLAFLARRVWRYFFEQEDDDDFANRLATLAVAHRWIFPVYLLLLTSVAVLEFLGVGNLFFSLSILCLASSLRRYYCEADFADHPWAQQIHLAMSLALLWLGWQEGYGHYLSDPATLFHWQVLAWAMLAVATWAFSQFYNNSDLAAHRQAFFFFLCCWLALGVLGGIGGYHLWHRQELAGSPWSGAAVGAIIAGLPLLLVFFRWLRHVTGQRLGGFIYDVVFSEGGFAEKPRKQKHLPEMLLLQHWRDQGDVEKAWQAAQAHLVKEERALPIWLFAMETAILYRRKPDEALAILRQLCVSEEFPYDHRTVAVALAQGWMAAAGFEFNAAKFQIERPPLQPTELTNKVEQKCREGRFAEAAAMLQDVLKDDCLNEPAFVQLVRLYCQDLKNRPAAEKLIAGARDTFSPKLLEFLERSLDEWLRLPIRSTVKRGKFLGWLRPAEPPEPGSKKISILSPPITQNAGPTSSADPLESYMERVKQSYGKPPDTTGVFDRVEKLLLERRLGTAVELIKQQAEAAPKDFDLWLRYAEAHGHHCGDPNAAERIILRMERSGNFKKMQLKKAHTRLKKWRKKHATHRDNW